MKIKRITPEEFKIRMQDIARENSNDPEVAHAEADSLMMKTLTDLGYEEGVKAFNDIEKWYA